MSRRRYTKRRCKAKIASGKRCRKFELEETGACGIPAHQAQVAATEARKTATGSRARATPKPPKPSVRVLKNQQQFLASYAKHGVIATACDKVGIDRRRHYEWLEDPRYPDYEAEFKIADETAVDRWEEELVRRTVEGTDEVKRVERDHPELEEPLVEITTVRKYSDSLFALLMKGRRRRIYNPERRHAIKHEGIPAGPAPQVILVLPSNGREAPATH